jgi:hypothetical protein
MMSQPSDKKLVEVAMASKQVSEKYLLSEILELLAAFNVDSFTSN